MMASRSLHHLAPWFAPEGVGEARLPLTTLSEFPEPPLSTARVEPPSPIQLIRPSLLAFTLFGRAPMLVPLRPSNEHILIVRVPGAQDQCGCPPNPFIVGALRAQRAVGRSPASNCTRSSGTALCPTCSMGQACASGLVCLLSVIRPPRPNQSWECRAMGCPSPQSLEESAQRFLGGRRTYQPWNQ